MIEPNRPPAPAPGTIQANPACAGDHPEITPHNSLHLLIDTLSAPTHTALTFLGYLKKLHPIKKAVYVGNVAIGALIGGFRWKAGVQVITGSELGGKIIGVLEPYFGSVKSMPAALIGGGLGLAVSGILARRGYKNNERIARMESDIKNLRHHLERFMTWAKHRAEHDREERERLTALIESQNELIKAQNEKIEALTK